MASIRAYSGLAPPCAWNETGLRRLRALDHLEAAKDHPLTVKESIKPTVGHFRPIRTGLDNYADQAADA